ncbi:MAG: leucyl/phenylalanyl-tRNA--protein transferase [Alteromonadales bacterium]|nr:leucyl/phenylalanyl-tRNA--protein transferase [Alteromonadales bacterium]
MTIYLPQLGEDASYFPNIDEALAEPDGLLAMGGDLSPQRIISAYRNGIFPWFSEGEPLLWWSPSERATICPGNVHISKSMKRFINKNHMSITLNHSFSEVITACAKPRVTQAETWITNEMIDAYIKLHKLGLAHSIEVWFEDELVGGLYGICVGQTFCGESMFSQMNNSSKLAFIALNQHFQANGGKLIDCQMQTEHLKSLGVNALSRADFKSNLLLTRDSILNKGCWDKQPLSVKTTF